MTAAARITLVVLVLDAAVLAAGELLYLPLHVSAVPFPITIGLAVASPPWLVRSAAELGGSRGIAAIPLTAWVCALRVFGIGGPGDDVLLAADWRSALLLSGGMFRAVVVLGRLMAHSPGAGPLAETRVGGDTVQVDGPFRVPRVRSRRTPVTYVIAEPCVDVMDRSCIEECPVDCIYEGGRMLYIQPDECVDCGACEPVCPVEAIYYEDDVPDQWKDYTKANVDFFTELGSPGGASKVGPVNDDPPMIAELPPQNEE